MNIRKLISFLETMTIGVLTYIMFTSPKDFFIKGVFYFGVILIVESIYYGYEYFKFIKPKKIFLLETRFSFNIDFFLNILFGSLFVSALILNWSELAGNPEYGFMFTIVSSIRGFIFNKQKQSIRLDSNKLQFDELFINDIWINEIQNVNIESKKNNIYVKLYSNKRKVLKLKSDFLEVEKERIEKFIEKIKNVA